jgi:hypothetical protein
MGRPLLPLDPAAPARAAGLDLGTSYLVFDRELGWVVGPGRRSANGLYESTSFGARRDSAQADPAPRSPVWVTAFGDSFTHGDDVGGAETWQHFLAARSSKAVVNFGVPGYGVDQAYLRYLALRGDWPSPHVLIGFMADHIGRHLNRYRPFISPSEHVFFVKPRFVLRGDELALVRPPLESLEEYGSPSLAGRLAEVGRQDYWYRPERYERRGSDHVRVLRVLRTIRTFRQSETERWRALYRDAGAVRLTERLLERFAAEVRRAGGRELIVFFPEETFLRDALEGRPSLAEPVLGEVAAAGFAVLDLTPALARFVGDAATAKRHFLPHYSGALNQVVAGELAARLAAAAAQDSPSSRAP